MGIKSTQYENLMKRVDDGVLMVDQHNKIVALNPGFLRVFETEPNLMGVSYDDFIKRWKANTGNNSYTPLVDNILAGKAEQMGKEQTIVITGRTKHLLEECYLLKGKKNEIQGAMLMVKDQSEVRLMRNHINQVDKFAAVGQLAAGLAHEIRNPMTSLKGFSQLLLDKERDEKNKAIYRIMIDDLDRINSLITEFLLLAKPSVPSFTVFNLRELLDSVLFLLNSEAALKEVRLVSEYPTGSTPVYADMNQIKQVFLNVIRNALDASPPNSKITVSISKSESSFSVKITDEGSGITPEISNRLFDPFFTTKDTGTGLGLSISHQILKSHGGDISLLENPSGIGCTCSILLPEAGSQLAEVRGESI